MKIVDRKTKEEREVINPNGAGFLYNNFFGRIILKLLIHPFTANIVNKYMSSKLSIKRIESTIKENNINMNLFVDEEYHCYNDFFLRRKKDLNFDMNKDHFVSPADSQLLAIKLSKDTSFDIKGSIYNIDDIVPKGILDGYENGYCLIFRLEVKDYHHYHFIDNGTMDEPKFIKGVLHAVLPISMKRYRIFHTNSREYTILHTENFGDVVMVEVGALNIGKIVNEKVKKFSRGEEKGHFEFGGSTIILFVKDNVVTIDNDILLNSTLGKETSVSCGEKIGLKIKNK